MSQNKPKISVFTTCKNGGHFLRETLDSILNQTFEDFEIVLVDGASTDNTLQILEEEYKDEPRLRWISEPDNDTNEGFHKALAMARGEYVMPCCVSDGYLSKNWFQKCVDILDNDIEVSLVYGFPQYMMEDGALGKIEYSEFFSQPPPQKIDFLYFWFATFFHYPEITYCVREDVYKKMFPDANSRESYAITNPFMKFLYNFNVSGYLPYFLPVVAGFGRIHYDSRNIALNKSNKKATDLYISDVIQYRNNVLSGRIQHVFRDGTSEIVKAIEPHQLRYYKSKVLEYRMTRNNHFGYVDKVNLDYWKSKTRLGKIKGKVKKGIIKTIKTFF